MTRTGQGNTIGLVALGLLIGSIADELVKAGGWADLGTPGFLGMALKHFVPAYLAYLTGQLKPTSDTVRDVAKKLGGQ